MRRSFQSPRGSLRRRKVGRPVPRKIATFSVFNHGDRSWSRNLRFPSAEVWEVNREGMPRAARYWLNVLTARNSIFGVGLDGNCHGSRTLALQVFHQQLLSCVDPGIRRPSKATAGSGSSPLNSQPCDFVSILRRASSLRSKRDAIHRLWQRTCADATNLPRARTVPWPECPVHHNG